jgi:hypothetical protein
VCGGSALVEVLSLPPLPVAINAQTTPEAAPTVDRGAMELVVCAACSHLFNRAFDPELSAYDSSYENTLHYSPRFRAHATELAARLVADHGLAGATVAELGAGPGHFLTMLCQAGAAAGHGFDPSYDPERLGAPEHPGITLSTELYPSDGSLTPKLALSQHVLEHLTDPVAILGVQRDSVAPVDGAVYAEVPNGEVMIDRCALWDLIYEHYSYFTPVSLTLAATRSGLAVSASHTMFDDQFLAIEATPAGPQPDALPDADAVAALVERAVAFGETARKRIEAARSELAQYRERGPVALWGAGSKGMTYLNLVAEPGTIDAVIDVNPRKAGFGVPGVGGLAIAGPDRLEAVRPATVLIANPIYADEIRSDLADRGLTADVLPLWQ